MKFEKDFPSLKGNYYLKRIILEDIQENCLDKKRVSDAIDKHKNNLFINGEELKKELNIK